MSFDLSQIGPNNFLSKNVDAGKNRVHIGVVVVMNHSHISNSASLAVTLSVVVVVVVVDSVAR